MPCGGGQGISNKTAQNNAFFEISGTEKRATTKGTHDSCSVAENGLFWLHSAIVPLNIHNRSTPRVS
jgi:hypothetical protein